MKVVPFESLNPLNSAKRGGRAGVVAGQFARQLEALTGADDARLDDPAPAASSDDTLQANRSVSLRPMTELELTPGVSGRVMSLKPLADIQAGAGSSPDNEPGAGAALRPFDDEEMPGTKTSNQTEQERVEATVRRWIAQSFYGTMLRQMRNSPFKSDLFDGGRGGQAFTSMLDQHLAEHMGRATDKKLVGAIARKMLGSRNNPKASSGSKASRGARVADPAPAPAAETENPYSNVRIHVAPGLRA